MGLGVQMLGWDAEFCELLAGRGFRVVRFDNRDVGRSTKIDGGPRPDVMAALPRGTSSSASYTLDDMADDCVGLLDQLGVGGGAPGRRLAGRDDRPDRRDPAPGAGALAGVDHVDDGDRAVGSRTRRRSPALLTGRRRTARGSRSSRCRTVEGDRVAGVRGR